MEAAGIAPVTLFSERISHNVVMPCRLRDAQEMRRDDEASANWSLAGII